MSDSTLSSREVFKPGTAQMSVTIGIVVFVSSMVWALDPAAQAEIDSSDTIYQTTRASLDVGGGELAGPSGFRFPAASLGSAIQTGLTEGAFRITSGFIQRTGVADEVEPLVGDFNGDGVVDFDDFFLFAAAFGSAAPEFDLDPDGTVNFDDFFIFAINFGKKSGEE